MAPFILAPALRSSASQYGYVDSSLKVPCAKHRSRLHTSTSYVPCLPSGEGKQADVQPLATGVGGGIRHF